MLPPSIHHQKKLRAMLLILNAVVFAWILLFWSNEKVGYVDLTQGRRHTLSPFTKGILRTTEDEVFVEVYLSGELPAAFRRLRRYLREHLAGLAAYKNSFRYKFINPSSASSQQERNQFFSLLVEKGLQPTQLFYAQKGSKVEKTIFPGALMHYQGRTRAVNFLENSKLGSTEEIIHQAIEEIEHKIVRAWHSLLSTQKTHIGLISSHSTEEALFFEGAVSLLSQYYRVSRPRLEALPKNDYALIIMADPKENLSEQESYLLDQYIMGGGRVIFFAEALGLGMENLGEQKGYLPSVVSERLREMLFQYGVRVNANLVEDLRCARYPVVVGKMGNQPNIQLLDWPFFPVLQGNKSHIITRNVGDVLSCFVSSLDAIQTPSVTQTPLLYSAGYSKVNSYPVQLSLEAFRQDFSPEKYRAGPQTVAYLLEGTFPSVYKNRMLPNNADADTFLSHSRRTGMIVVGDGDIVKNEVHPKTKKASMVGMYSPEQKKYANDDFLLHAVSYLLDAEGLITTRNKKVHIRPLKRNIAGQREGFFRAITLLVPLFVITFLALLKQYIRTKKYASR